MYFCMVSPKELVHVKYHTKLEAVDSGVELMVVDLLNLNDAVDVVLLVDYELSLDFWFNQVPDLSEFLQRTVIL